jgi:hypothetical protein
MKDMNFSFVSFEKIQRIIFFEFPTLIHLPKGKNENINDKGLIFSIGEAACFFPHRGKK